MSVEKPELAIGVLGVSHTFGQRGQSPHVNVNQAHSSGDTFVAVVVFCLFVCLFFQLR